MTRWRWPRPRAAWRDGRRKNPRPVAGRPVGKRAGAPPISRLRRTLSSFRFAPRPGCGLFMSVGSRDGIGPGDLLGAAVDQAGIERAQVGRIEIQETFTRVEIRQQVAEKVVRALNGTTLGGTRRASGLPPRARAGTFPVERWLQPPAFQTPVVSRDTGTRTIRAA